MLKKIIHYTFLVYFVFSVAVTSGCGVTQTIGHRILGKWEHDGNIYEFRSDGKFVYGSKAYDFSVNAEKVTIDKQGEALTFDYTINNNGTLSMNGIIYYPVRR